MMDIKDIIVQKLREAFPSFAGAVSGENTKKEPLYITCCLESENHNELFEVNATHKQKLATIKVPVTYTTRKKPEWLEES